MIKHHSLNPSQALAVRHVLGASCITTLTRGAGTRKLDNLVACVKAVLWQQGYIVDQNPDAADPSTINLGRRGRGPKGDSPPPPLCAGGAPFREVTN